MKIIHTDKAPIPAGHYSQAVVHEGLVYVSGQLPINPFSGEKVNSSIQNQTQQVLCNLAAILEASGSSMDQVLRVTVYLSDISLWGKVNEVYSLVFGDHKPARSVVPTKELNHGFVVEVDAVAAVLSPEGDSIKNN
jgi:2-iminobutanoate/2-iminopropanoate deaminase